MKKVNTCINRRRARKVNDYSKVPSVFHILNISHLLNPGLQGSVVVEAIYLNRARIVVARALFRTLIVIISALMIW